LIIERTEGKMHKALGRGLDSLLGVSTAPVAQVDGEHVVNIPIDKVKPNRHQPRKHFDQEKLEELSRSIKIHGLQQPIIVSTTVVPGEYELIAGERRLRAAKLAGNKDIKAIIRDTNDKDRFQIALIENLQREDLNPIEEAKAFRKLIDEYQHTQEELSEMLGKDRSVIANSLRLLNLPVEVQESIEFGLISPGHGRILAGINDASRLKNLADRIIREKLTVREIEKIAGSWKTVVKGLSKKAKKQDIELIQLQEDLQRRLGTKVQLIGKPKKGKILIHYFSLEELERISAHLRGKKPAPEPKSRRI
jgi:ParB family chromosome partitioning protein